MKKNDRISEFIASLEPDPALALDPCYQGYFTCFNAQQYYEAHDVLEHLWLQTEGADHRFFKGLIQFAGAFVHLQKQFQHPQHRVHGRRLRPAARLFHLAIANVEPYAPRHLHLDLDALCTLARRHAADLSASDFTRNPWNPADPPLLKLDR